MRCAHRAWWRSMRFFPVLAAVLLVLIGADISEPRPADAASYCSAFRADLNIPDGTTMSPGQSFSKGWRLNNCGTAWNGVKAVRISGNFGPGEFGVPAAGAGANADLWTNMNAPTASGRHRATYRLRGPAGDFGTTFWVEVQVNAPAPPPPPAPAANDCMQFVRDLSYGDGAVVSAGQGFDKGWELRNCGNTNWNGYSAVRVGGGYGPDRFGVPGIGPNSSGGLWTRITAPGTAGRHRATYQLEGPRGRFGPQFWVEVVVSAPTGRLTVSSGLVLSSTNPRTGENVTVDFTVTNSGGQALTIQELTAGGRRGTDWNGEWMDFPHVANIVLQPGQSYRYRQSRSFPGTGAHFAEPAALINGSWGSIAGGNRVTFTVSGVPAGRLQISQALSLSTTNPSTSQAVTARFAVRNVGSQAIRFNILAAARRGTDWGGVNVDWPQQFDITLQPGQEYRYEQSRTFAGQTAGAYFAEPAVFTNGQWSGIDGGNRVTFTVGGGSNNGGTSDADLINKAKE